MPIVSAVVAVVAVLVLAVGTTLVTLTAVQMMPLGVFRRGKRRFPRAWRLLPIAAGIPGSWYVAMLGRDPNYEQTPLVGLISILAPLSILVGFFLSGAWVCHWLSRGLARLSRRATTLMVARRMAADPYSTFRSVSGAALAIYVATGIGLLAAHDRASAPAVGDVSSVLDDGVVAVHVRGAPEASLAPLMSPGVIVARLASDGQIVMACADLARVTDLGCPLPVYDEGPGGSEDYIALEDLFTLPYPGASSADHIFKPRGFVEPGPDVGRFPIQTLFIPTDGTSAAQERVRTIAAAAVPLSRSKISDDLPGRTVFGSVTGLETMLPYVMVFVLLVAACSLTISVINGVLERRRPFALLRASGVRLGELRSIVMLEIGIPLALSALGGVGLAMLNMYVTVPRSEWVLPSGTFLAGLGAGALAAFAVSLVALPFMDIATRQESVRFE